MSELDDRLFDGLRRIAEDAPVDADVWTQTERHLARHRRRRQASLAALAVVVVAAGAAVGLRSTNDHRLRVATTVPTTTTTTAHAIPDACPTGCIGRATADVDGDGRPDRIGLMADPPLSGDAVVHKPSRLTIRVVFATGRVADFHDTADWDASLVGAADVSGDGKAKIFYFNDTGASHHMGHILQWDGTRLVAVKGPDGHEYTTFIDGYALGGSGIRCVGNSFRATSISESVPEGWSASETIFAWHGDQLVNVAEHQPIPITDPVGPSGPSGLVGANLYVPPEYAQIIGVHCAGLTNSTY